MLWVLCGVGDSAPAKIKTAKTKKKKSKNSS
jgi:hypothetical protein